MLISDQISSSTVDEVYIFRNQSDSRLELWVSDTDTQINVNMMHFK